MKSKTTIEKLVSDAVQQSPLGTFSIDGREYVIDRPRVRTMIVVSELISQLPEVRQDKDATLADVLEQSLHVAKDCAILGDIAAVLILGAKHLTEEREIEKRRLFGLIRRKEKVTVDARRELADKLLLELDGDELKQLIETCLVHLKIPAFFALITSLSEVNLLKPTGEVTTTQSGQ